MLFYILCCAVLTEDESARIEQLYKEMFPTLIKYCNTRIESKEDSADLVQKAFTILVIKYSDIKHDNLKSWIYRVTDYLIRNQNKTSRNRDSFHTEISIEDVTDENFVLEREGSEICDIIMSSLSEKDLEYFNTYFVDFTSHEQAAKKYNISISASKVRKKRLKTQIIRILQNNGLQEAE